MLNKGVLEEALESVQHKTESKSKEILDNDHMIPTKMRKPDHPKAEVIQNLGSESSTQYFSCRSDQIVCCVCGKEATGAHKCTQYRKIVNIICGEGTSDLEREGFGSSVLCLLCSNKKNMISNKYKAMEGLLCQANKYRSL